MTDKVYILNSQRTVKITLVNNQLQFIGNEPN